ncbi:TPA: plasmid SOS inhibition protein A [Enterobacter hormaechei]
MPRHLSLVTQRPEREAALRAIMIVEEETENSCRRSQQPNPYARAFFRVLTGSCKLSTRTIRCRGATG